MSKILIIRLSSIGDIVLTSPVVRCLKTQFPNLEVHFLCKNQYVDLIKNNPYIDKIFRFDKTNHNLIAHLKSENYDFIIDLQNNLRSQKLCFALHKPATHLHKLNFRKWLLVNFKINTLLPKHIVDRYFEAVKKFFSSLKNDNLGLDFFTNQFDHQIIEKNNLSSYVAIAIGSRHNTKKIPVDKLLFLTEKITEKIVLLGDKEDFKNVQIIENDSINKIINLCGKTSIGEAATIVKHAKALICGDTGLMHIGAAFDVPIVSVWGNTVPDFGMYAYRPNGKSNVYIEQIENLPCRPCSKLGFKSCPKKHFKCMNAINYEKIAEIVNKMC